MHTPRTYPTLTTTLEYNFGAENMSMGEVEIAYTFSGDVFEVSDIKQIGGWDAIPFFEFGPYGGLDDVAYSHVNDIGPEAMSEYFCDEGDYRFEQAREMGWAA
jgi:hypothetical protein